MLSCDTFFKNFSLGRWHLDSDVADGEGAAGVDVAVLLVRQPPAVQGLGDVDLAGDQAGVAPAALAAAAPGGHGDAAALQGLEDGVVGGAGDGPGLPPGR